MSVCLDAQAVEEGLDVWLAEHLQRVVAGAGVLAGSIRVVVVADAQMVELHEQHKGSAQTTDVLSFDLRDRPNDPLDADLVICLDEAVRQVMRRGHTVAQELLLYAVHGLLHMLGHNDHDAEQAAAMHQREDQLLALVGIGPLHGGQA